MNYAQFCLFLVYAISVFTSGIAVSSLLDNSGKLRMNWFLFTGETLLFGSIILVGELLILSLTGLYKTPFLWGIVILNYSLFFKKDVRINFYKAFSLNKRLDPATGAFILLLIIFIFRNCYFLIDVDSLSTYLFTQKLWVSSGTSLIGNANNDIRIFLTQFDAVPYSLGISVFGQETLFPQLVSLSWRVIAVFLIFGYTAYRLNSYYGLAAALFVVLNDHFFYSGANQWVMINAAVIAFIFSAAYNFWESRSKQNVLYFVVALIFLSQLMANKTYLFFSAFFLLIVGIIAQPAPLNKIKDIFYNKKYLLCIVLAVIFVSLWYLKNLIITQDPFFPMFAGKFHIFGRTTGQDHLLLRLLGGLSPLKIFKFISFIFIWPGVNPAKYVLLCILFLPFVMLMCLIKNKINREEVIELCYWMAITIAALLGMCLVTWQDPRAYRFLIGLYSFTAVFAMRFFILNFFNIKREIVPSCIIILLSLQGYSIINNGGVIVNRPTIRENIGVLLNKIHADYVIKKHHPEVYVAIEGLNANKDKVASSAWALQDNSNAFFLPDRPIISLLLSSTISWDSYMRENLILNDLQANNIKWVMNLRNDGLAFIPIQEFALLAVKIDRFPKKTYYDYGFPKELLNID